MRDKFSGAGVSLRFVAHQPSGGVELGRPHGMWVGGALAHSRAVDTRGRKHGHWFAVTHGGREVGCQRYAWVVVRPTARTVQPIEVGYSGHVL